MLRSGQRLGHDGRSTLSTLFRLSAESLFATLFPADCRLCGADLLNVSRLPVCTPCLQNILSFDHAQCSVCGELLLGSRQQAFASDRRKDPDQLELHPETQVSSLCGMCQRARPSYQSSAARGPYEGVLRELVHLLKYHQIRPAAKPLGEALAFALAQLAGQIGSDAMLVPVPLHKARLYERGFNQAEEIARAAMKHLPAEAREWKIDARVLVRKRATLTQTGLTRHQRRENIRGAFAVRRPDLIAGKRIVLVDDVFTTGTTAEECAKVLRRAGAAQVWIATAARVSRLETLAKLESGVQAESAASAGFASSAAPASAAGSN